MICWPISIGSTTTAVQEGDLRLNGRVFDGDTPVRDGIVVLHSVSPDSAGDIDSVRVAADGTFRFLLPGIPDETVGAEIYFASIQYERVLYFGTAITDLAQLDSLYLIQVFGSHEVPPQGIQLPLKARNLFLERSAEGWLATDMIVIENVGQNTLVAGEDGIVWSYPLPPEARSPTLGQGELAPDAVSFEDGRVAVSAPIPPGERILVIRYGLPELESIIPVPGPTERFELFIKEPAPPLDVEGLQPIDVVSLEVGSSYRRYGASALLDLQVALKRSDEDGPPPVRAIALLVTILMSGAGLFAYAWPRRLLVERGALADSREGLILAVAKIDRTLLSTTDLSQESHMLEQRAALMSRLLGGS